MGKLAMRPMMLLAGLLLFGLSAVNLVLGQVPPPPTSTPAPMPAASTAPTTAADATTAPTIRTITQPEVEVRCGGDKCYATSKLHRGDKVTVLRESKEFPGWLEIKPPPGSFSWINANVVEPRGPYVGVVITAEDAQVPVLAGSLVTRDPPNKTQGKVKRGTIVIMLDRAFESEKGRWLPIEPTLEEVRYIPASAVEGSSREEVVSNRPANRGSRALITQAEQALKGNNLNLAKQLLVEAANQTADTSERNYCYSMLNQITQTLASQTSQSQGNVPAAGNWMAQNASQTQIRSPDGSVVRSNNPFQTAQLNKAGPARWGTWGYLRRTATRFNGQPVFVLENKDRQPVEYLTTTPNFSLDSYVGRLICTYGTVSQDDNRRDLVTVSHVAVPPATR